MFCKYCGKEITNDSVFCSHCGKQQNLEEIVFKNSKPQLTKKRFTKKNYIIGAGVLFLCLTIWIGSTFFRNKKIADTTIDKVTEELAKATRKYDCLYSFHEGLARVKKGDKYGYIDKLGHEIIECKYDDAHDFEYGVARIKNGKKEGLINMRGKMVVTCKFDNISPFGKDSTASAYIDNLGGIINIKGETIIPFEYEDCRSFSDGLASVRKKGLYGFVDRKKNLVVPCIYEDARSFCEGLAAVKHKGHWGFIDVTGKVVIPFQEGLYGGRFHDGLTTISRGKVQISFDTNGKPDVPFAMAYMDKNGKLVSDWHIGILNEYVNGYATFSDEERLFEGMIDKHGNIIIPCIFTSIAYGLNDNELVWVSQGSGERDGFFNIKTGSLAIPCEYEIYNFEFSEGLKAVKKSGKCGFINPSNEIVIPFNYDEAGDFSEGFAVVERYGKDGYVDRYGNDTFSFQ